TYVPARRGQAASGPEEVTDSAVSTRAVIVSAKGAARWQAGHPWIYRTDIYDESRDAPGIVTVTDRRGRHLGQALYSPTSEIRLRLLTTGREAIGAARFRTRWPWRRPAFATLPHRVPVRRQGRSSTSARTASSWGSTPARAGRSISSPTTARSPSTSLGAPARWWRWTRAPMRWRG